MNYYVSSILVALVLLASSAVLIASHIRAWKRLQGAKLDVGERVFRRRQYRRRMQTSALLGVLGMAIFIGQLLARVSSRHVLVIYWSGILVLVLWMALLALADMTATSYFYSQKKTDDIVEHARLQAELQRARDEAAPRRNGKPRPSP